VGANQERPEARGLSSFFDIRPAEERLVLLLLAHSVCLGIVRVTSETAANALFVQRYGAAALPLAFMAAAITNPLVSLVYARLGGRLSFGRLLSLSLWVLLMGTLACRALLFLDARWPTLLLILFFQTVYLLTGLEFWGLCSRIFDVRQAKRLFGLIGSGELASQIFMGLSIPLLLKWGSTANLLLISGAGLMGCISLLAAVRAIPQVNLEEPEAEQDSPGRSSLGRLSKNRYVVMLWAVTAFYTVSSYFIFQIFYDVASQRYPDESQLAGFLGLYQALCGALALLMGSFATGFVLERMGLAVGLLCLPVGVVGAAAIIAVSGMVPAGAGLLFGVALLLKVQDDAIFDTLYRPAFQTLRQPLPSDVRASAQMVGEGLVEPIFGGLTGLLDLLRMGARLRPAGLDSGPHPRGPAGRSHGRQRPLGATDCPLGTAQSGKEHHRAHPHRKSHDPETGPSLCRDPRRGTDRGCRGSRRNRCGGWNLPVPCRRTRQPHVYHCLR
jgi:AAA family ATP:ADP antiporter